MNLADRHWLMRLLCVDDRSDQFLELLLRSFLEMTFHDPSVDSENASNHRVRNSRRPVASKEVARVIVLGAVNELIPVHFPWGCGHCVLRHCDSSNGCEWGKNPPEHEDGGWHKFTSQGEDVVN
jgi:hypothetical protein